MQKKQRKQIKKIGKIQKTIVNYEQEIKILTEQHEKVCAEELSKEKKRSIEAIKNVRRKLEIAQKNAIELETALKQTKKIAKIETQNVRLKRQAEETLDPVLKKELTEQTKKLDAQIADLEKIKEEAKQKAQKYQVELDQKSTDEIKGQRKQTLKAEKQVQKEMKEALAKQASIEKALKTEKDPAVRKALEKELKIVKKNLSGMNRKLREFQAEHEALAHELELQDKVAAQRKKEEELKEAILAKNNKDKETQIRSKFFTSADKVKVSKLADTKKFEEKELAEQKKKLKIVMAEYTTYKIALKAGNKKKLLDILGEIKKKSEEEIEKLGKELKQVKLEGQRYQVVLSQTNSAKIKELTAKLSSEAKAKELNLNKEISAAIAKGDAAVKAEELNSKADIEREKAKAKREIEKIEKEIAKLQTSTMTTKLALKKELVQQQSYSDEIESDLDLEKKQTAQRQKEISDYILQEEKSLKSTMDSLTKQTKKDVKKVEGEIAALKKKQKIEEALLTAALKAANKEVIDTQKAIEKEEKDYAKLEVEMKEYIEKENKKTIEDVRKEIAKRDKKKDDLTDKQKKCQTEIRNEESSLKKLKSEFEITVDELKKMQDIEKKRAVAKDTLQDYETQLLKLKAQGMELLSNIESVCYDDSADSAGNCDKLRKDQEALRKDTENMKLKVDSTLDEYMKL